MQVTAVEFDASRLLPIGSRQDRHEEFASMNPISRARIKARRELAREGYAPIYDRQGACATEQYENIVDEIRQAWAECQRSSK